MNSGNSELSNKKNAFIGWIEALGFILFIVSRIFFREYEWLLFIAVGFILIAFFYRLYLDWKNGNTKRVKSRLIVFVLILIASAVLAYFTYQRGLI
jgi:thiol:disulfide interchange protein